MTPHPILAQKAAAHLDGNSDQPATDHDPSSIHDNALPKAGSNEILVAELRAADRIRHEVMGDLRRAAELSALNAAAELPSDLSGPRLFGGRGRRYELP